MSLGVLVAHRYRCRLIRVDLPTLTNTRLELAYVLEASLCSDKKYRSLQNYPAIRLSKKPLANGD